MCYMLDIVTYKSIGRTEIKEYREKYSLCIDDKTLTMKNAESNKHYYSLSRGGGCACEYYQYDPGNGYKLFELLTECVELGEVILFFYWDDGDYNLIDNDVYTYINKTKQIQISLDGFLYDFLTKQFRGRGVIFRINK